MSNDSETDFKLIIILFIFLYKYLELQQFVKHLTVIYFFAISEIVCSGVSMILKLKPVCSMLCVLSVVC